MRRTASAPVLRCDIAHGSYFSSRKTCRMDNRSALRAALSSDLVRFGSSPEAILPASLRASLLA